MCHALLRDPKLYDLLFAIDQDLAAQTLRRRGRWDVRPVAARCIVPAIHAGPAVVPRSWDRRTPCD